MKMRIKLLFVSALAAWLAHAAPLDTTISNSYWCTYAYTNAVPSTINVAKFGEFTPCGSTAKASLAAAEAFLKGSTLLDSLPLPRFRSTPPSGEMIIIR